MKLDRIAALIQHHLKRGIARFIGVFRHVLKFQDKDTIRSRSTRGVENPACRFGGQICPKSGDDVVRRVWIRKGQIRIESGGGPAKHNESVG